MKKILLLVVVCLLVPAWCFADGAFYYSQYPDGDGFENALAQSGCSGDHYTCVNADAESSYLYSDSATWEYELFDILNLSASEEVGTPTGITVRVKARASNASHNADLMIAYRYSSTTYDSGEELDTELTTDWAWYEYSWPLDLTYAELDNIEAGFKAQDSAFQVQVCEVQVDFWSDVRWIGALGGDNVYDKWEYFWDDFGGLKTGNARVAISGYQYHEDDAPSTITEEFNGYTLTVTLATPYYQPRSGDAETGVKFILDYASSTDEALDLNTGLTDTGKLVLEGLVFDARWGDTSPEHIIYSRGGVDLEIRNCVFRGTDTAGDYGIRMGGTVSDLTMLNSFVQDFDDGVYLGSSADATLIHNTVVSNINGIYRLASAPVAINNLVYDNTTADFGGTWTTATGHNNLCSDATCENTDFDSSATESANDPPTADGSTTDGGGLIRGGSGTVCTSGNCWDCVDDWGADVWANHLGTTFAVHGDEWRGQCFDSAGITEVANTTITQVQIDAQYAGDSQSKLVLRISDGSNTVDSSTLTMASDDWGSGNYYNPTFATAPDGTAWEWSDIAGLKTCIRMDADVQMYVGWLGLTVFYIDASGNLDSQTVTFTGTSDGEYYPVSGEEPINAGMDYIADPDNGLGAIARYQFESGFMNVDSSENSNTLSSCDDESAPEDLGDFATCTGNPDENRQAPEGSSNAYLDGGASFYYRNNLLSSNDEDFTVCFWYIPHDLGTFDALVSERNQQSGNEAWSIYKTSANQIAFYSWYDNTGTATANTTLVHDTALLQWNVYWVCVSYDETDYDMRIRIWDYYQGEPHGVDAYQDLNNGEMYDSTAKFVIGADINSSGNAVNFSNARFDDVIVFDSELTPEQMDMVRILEEDAFERGRGSQSNFFTGMGEATDIGAYEYITPREYHFADSGCNDNNSAINSGVPWCDPSRLSLKTLSPDDEIIIADGDTITHDWSVKATGANGAEVEITSAGTVSNITYSSAGDAFSLYGKRVNLTNLNFQDNGGDALQVSWSENIDIEDCDFIENGYEADCDGCTTTALIGFGTNDMDLTNVTLTSNACRGIGYSYSQGWHDLDTVIAYYNGQTGLCTNANGGGSQASYNMGEILNGYSDFFDDNMNVTDSVFSRGGRIGWYAGGDNSRHGGCTWTRSVFDWNGDGWAKQGVGVFNGTVTGALVEDDMIMDIKAEGVTDGFTVADFLKDVDGDFINDGVIARDIAVNLDEETWSYVLDNGSNDANSLELEYDIFDGGDERYLIGNMGLVHRANSAQHEYDDSTAWLSIKPEFNFRCASDEDKFCFYDAQCSAESECWLAGTGQYTGHCCDGYYDDWDETDTNKFYKIGEYGVASYEKDTNNYWTPDGTMIDYAPRCTWGGGGLDFRFSEGCEVSYSTFSNTRGHYGSADAYGLNFDDESDGCIGWGNIAHDCDGAGFEMHNSGKTTANAFYNSLSYHNTVDATYSGGFFINNKGGKSIVKNCISVEDGLYSLVVRWDSPVDDVTLDNNIYYQDTDNDTIIMWHRDSVATAGSGGSDDRLEITISPTNIDADLAHFPFMIYLSSSSGTGNDDVTAIFDELGSDYEKIIVKNSAGDELDVEVEFWDETAEEAILWVSRSDWVIDDTTDTVINLFYSSAYPDNTTYVGASGSGGRGGPRESVWDGNYKLVAHMGEASGTVYDSTAFDNDGTFDGTYGATGQIGDAMSFNGTSNEIDFGDPAEIHNSNMTITVWGAHDTPSGSARAFSKDITGEVGSYIMWLDGSGYLEFLASNSSQTWYRADSNASMGTANVWYKLTGRIDTGVDEEVTLWRNATELANATGMTSAYDTAHDFRVGSTGNDAHFWKGDLDEIRISTVARSDAWIKAEYYSETDGLATIEVSSGGSNDNLLEDSSAFFQSYMVGLDIVRTDPTACTTTITTVTDANSLTTNTGDCTWAIDDEYYISIPFKADHATDADFTDYQNATFLSSQDANSYAQDAGVYVDGGSYKIGASSIAKDNGTPVATEIGCTAGSTCLDYYGTVVPYNTLWDIGIHEFTPIREILFYHYRRLRQ